MKNARVDYKSIMRWVLMGAGPGKVKPLRQNNGRRRVALWHTLSRLRSRSKSTSAGTLTQTPPPISSPLHTGNKWSSEVVFILKGSYTYWLNIASFQKMKNIISDFQRDVISSM